MAVERTVADLAIRPLATDEFAAAGRLIVAVMRPLLEPACRPDDVAAWVDAQRAEQFAMLAEAGVRFFAATRDAELVGVAALRDHHHLYQLYVAAPWQRRGIGRALWEHVLAEAQHDGALAMYVNAWPDAVAIYRRFGFAPVGSRTTHRGVPRQPMVRMPPGSER
jgi:GNAT superfamily N-acetyltransferase